MKTQITRNKNSGLGKGEIIFQEILVKGMAVGLVGLVAGFSFESEIVRNISYYVLGADAAITLGYPYLENRK